MQQHSIIITAGGTGKRMNSVQPKQFLLLHGKPVLLHTLERLYRHIPDGEFILTLPADHIDAWEQLCREHGCSIPHKIIAGGAERYHSVKAALAHCEGQLIAVHDGVRPLVSVATLDRLFEAAKTHDAVIPVIDLKESLRKVNSDGSHSVPRSAYKVVQTPQVFRAAILRKAYELPYTSDVTDDAGLVEASGTPVFLVAGNEENVKITTPADLPVAAYFLGDQP